MFTSQGASAAQEFTCGRVGLADGEVLDHVQVVAFASEGQIRPVHWLNIRTGSRQHSHGEFYFQPVCAICSGRPHHPQQQAHLELEGYQILVARLHVEGARLKQRCLRSSQTCWCITLTVWCALN